MSYCFNCGAKIEENIRFCFQCGAKLKDETADDENLKFWAKPSDEKEGIIMTNLDVLSQKFGVEENIIVELLHVYVQLLEDLSIIHYSLLDIDGSGTWEDHVDFLKNHYDSLSVKPKYLFIVGGHDVIPMPEFANVAYYTGDSSDQTVDTDLPYAYLLDVRRNTNIYEKYEKSIYNLKIFRKNPRLYVGRLPFAKEATFDDLKNYLFQAGTFISDEMSITRGFGITNECWKKSSVETSEGIYRHGSFTRANDQKPTHYGYNELYVSPELKIEDINAIFDRDAGMYFFNLHGSSEPGNPNFVSDIERRTYPDAFTPGLIAAVNRQNIFVTEACYGAKYKSYDKRHSMLLSAINNKTILYLGSSRIAWGMDVGISQADVLCKTFLNELLLEGKSAGRTLTCARIAVLLSAEKNPVSIVTAIEFNLFGDPSLCLPQGTKAQGKNVSDGNEIYKSSSSEDSEDDTFTVDVLYTSDNSILNRVRNRVNENLQKIRTSINEHLYQYYNVEPRSLSRILSVKYGSGDEFFYFVYNLSTPDHQHYMLAYADDKGQIKSILTSK